MQRRAYLTGAAGITAGFLAGCSGLSNNSESGNGTSGSNSTPGDGTSTAEAGASPTTSESSTSPENDTESATAADTETATDRPAAITGVTFGTTEMQVQLRADAGISRLDLLDPAGENIASKQVRSATQVSFPLVSRVSGDPITSIYSPGEYTVVAVSSISGRSPSTSTGSLEQRVANAGPKQTSGSSRNEARNERRTVRLEPDVSITDIEATQTMPRNPAGISSDSEINGSFAVQLTNDGTVPVWITQSRLYGEELPVTRTGENLGDDLHGAAGAALDWYDKQIVDLNSNSEGKIPLPIGTHWYRTTYLPLAIPERSYEPGTPDEIREQVNQDYGFTTPTGVLSLTFSDGSPVAGPFRALFAGEARRYLRMGLSNVYEFSDSQVAFNPDLAVVGDEAMGNFSSSFGENASGPLSFPSNVTGMLSTANGSTSTGSTLPGTTTGATTTNETGTATESDSASTSN